MVKKRITLKKGECVRILKKMPDKSVNMIFADPPYNLSGKNHITCINGRKVKCDKGVWDMIDDIDKFNYDWILECMRVLTDDGTIWISGTLHNHPSVGFLLKRMGYWIINDVVWYKPNAPPQLQPNRLAPSIEMIWLASKTKKYKFNYQKGKEYNNGKQLRNMWTINAKRHITKHPAEKPEDLLERIIQLGSNKNDVVLDPFMGSGTTGVIAKRLNRNFIGIEIDEEFFNVAKERIKKTKKLIK